MADILFTFELKYEINTPTSKGVKTAVWEGTDGLDACQRYADAHPGVTVIAWRQKQPLIVTGPIEIIEPGHRLFGKKVKP